MDIPTRVQQAFAKQAPRFDDPQLTLARADLLQWALSHLSLSTEARVLDVCAGTGIVARALAPQVHLVVAIDVTMEMLRQLTKRIASEQLANVTTLRGLAEALPVRSGAFDVVVTRLSLHHVAQPAMVMSEMVRACRPGGTLGIIDLVAPDDAGLAARYNEYERLRDPSHVRALAEGELAAVVEGAGVRIATVAARDIEVDADAWLELTHTNPTDAARLNDALRGELEGGAPSGLRPFHRDGRLGFLQRWVVIVAHKA